MPRRYILDDSESSSSEFSETDISLSSPHGRRRIKRQSFSRSRQRVSPNSNAYLDPNLISTVRRSASTGNRRHRENEPMVIIDVNNDVRNRQDSRDRHDRYERTDRHDRHDRHQRIADFDDDDIEVLRSHRRNRASSNVSATRTPSPRQQQRDWEVLMDQRILARNDIRQDLEITKQQQEIDRLERQLSRHKEKKRPEKSESHSRHRFEEIHYEDDLSEKLRKLDRLEKAKRNEEEQRLAEVRAKVKRLEEMERRAEEEEEAKRLAHERHLKEIEERENIKAEKDRLKKELQDEEARKALEESERKKELAMLKAQAVDEWKRAEDSKRLKEIKEKEAKDREFKERLRAEFGYSEEQIEKMLNKKNDEEKKEKKKEKDKDGKLVILEPEKTTFIKVKSTHPIKDSVFLTHAIGA
jgi:hypothetical protein